MSKRLDANQMTAALKTPGPKRAAGSRVDKFTPPVQEMGIEVTLDQVRAYDRNPRTQRNSKYEEIKASIREVGLKHPPSVTQRPGDDKYMISDGGNTRLEILNELWDETKDEKFYRFWCVYRPWVSEVHALAGHLSENESRSDLTWIEKSLGVKALKDELEAAAGDES
ncbi:ParB family protein, partial [Halomonas sp. THAF12]|uniref:ParB family protein n=1 Tax=Halomonas sp. B23F22_10 TaxID=3459515 RepID=UPI00373F72A9